MAGKVFSDVYNESARDTGDTTSSHVTYVKKKVNDALREICAEMLYAFMKRTSSLTLVASTQAYTITTFATDFDPETPADVWYRGAGKERIVLDPFDDTEWNAEEDLDEGDCYGYNISKKSGSWKIYMVYVPNSAFVTSYSPLTFDYFKQVAELSGASDVPEIPTAHHQGLVYWTNKLICAEMGDTEGFATWERLAERAIGLMKKRQVQRLGRQKRVNPRSCLTVKERSRQRRDYNL